jgi:hypothetical protein
MKQLRILFLWALLSLSSNTVFGQSKAETIAWLKEKVGSYIEDDTYNKQGQGFVMKELKLEDLNECEFTVSYKLYYKKDELLFSRKLTLPTGALTVEPSGKITYKSEVVKSFIIRAGESETDYLNSSAVFSIAKREDDILPRVQKAFDHLGTFCIKKKEAF